MKSINWDLGNPHEQDTQKMGEGPRALAAFFQMIQKFGHSLPVPSEDCLSLSKHLRLSHSSLNRDVLSNSGDPFVLCFCVFK